MKIKREEVKETLGDLDPMPYGKHRGIPMQDVPASYLHWLWHNGLRHEKNAPVHKYIVNSMSALEVENPDLIW